MPYPQEAFREVTLSAGSFLRKRRHIVAESTLIYQLDVLRKTGRYDAFKLGWHESYSDSPDVWPIPNHLFWDSDVAKWIEGACYLLHDQPQQCIDNAVTELVDMIKSAQQTDGYINIHFTVVEPGKRFSNLRDFHELYNAGHLIEAALAHNLHYGNDQLLEPVLKYVDLLCRTFGPADEQIHGYPGHPEIELALLRLYHRTKEPKHLALAEFFIRERGNPIGDHGEHFFRAEAQRRGDDPNKRPRYYPEAECLWYYVAHQPLVQQASIQGHSVRAMYFLTAAADFLQYVRSPEPQIQTAIHRLWDNMVDRKMYITGGIGSIKQWEGFGLDYFLPQSTDEGGCYAETCAAIGVMMLAERMLQNDLNGKFADIMELCLFNAVLTSMSHNGREFTYVNQLASSEQDPSKREAWFTCACCPPNVLRLLGQIGGYIYSLQPQTHTTGVMIDVHLYASSTIRFELDGHHGMLSQETAWPSDGKVVFRIENASPNLTVRLRIPSWASDWKVAPSLSEVVSDQGYLTLSGEWLSVNSSFELNVAFKPRLVSPHPYTNQDTLAICRGPLVYCVEDFDNSWVQDHFKGLWLDPACQIVEKSVVDSKTGETYIGLTVIKGAVALEQQNHPMGPSTGALSLDEALTEEHLVDELHFVPYYFRANRGGRGQARVGLRRWRR